MSGSDQQKFLVLYLVPTAVIDNWMNTPEAERQAATEKLRGEWISWFQTHASAIISNDAAGKTKRVTPAGVSDTRNEILTCSVVHAESHDAAARMFEGHPHLQIPQASIEIMHLRPMGPM